MKTIIIVLFMITNVVIAAGETTAIKLEPKNIETTKGREKSLTATCSDIEKHFKGKKEMERDNYSWQIDPNDKDGKPQKIIDSWKPDSKYTTGKIRLIIKGDSGVHQGDTGSITCSAKEKTCTCKPATCFVTIG